MMKFLLIVAMLTGCGTAMKAPEAEHEITYLGIAEMRPDGTMVLTMYVDGEGRDAFQVIEYKPTDKNYDLVRKHVGGLMPGEQKPVHPWPDKK